MRNFSPRCRQVLAPERFPTPIRTKKQFEEKGIKNSVQFNELFYVKKQPIFFKKKVYFYVQRRHFDCNFLSNRTVALDSSFPEIYRCSELRVAVRPPFYSPLAQTACWERVAAFFLLSTCLPHSQGSFTHGERAPCALFSVQTNPKACMAWPKSERAALFTAIALEA